ncbi:MAG: hypothetical protein HY785_22130 [Oscillatoriophycideae cyanobacterium NC_groundwater_1537_Pr4_S-0.65um_50_18]|nr:hypothetical protein [Oscillatoriophycideae cyanobacterium NC_groundwater_1537_Pr4_S-0.65um_50_18]
MSLYPSLSTTAIGFHPLLSGSQDITHQRVKLPELMADQIAGSNSLTEAFEKTAEALAQEYKETLAQAPVGTPFDYKAIAESTQLTLE